MESADELKDVGLNAGTAVKVPLSSRGSGLESDNARIVSELELVTEGNIVLAVNLDENGFRIVFGNFSVDGHEAVAMAAGYN
jgi:hypothetical protein